MENFIKDVYKQLNENGYNVMLEVDPEKEIEGATVLKYSYLVPEFQKTVVGYTGVNNEITSESTAIKVLSEQIIKSIEKAIIARRKLEA